MVIETEIRINWSTFEDMGSFQYILVVESLFTACLHDARLVPLRYFNE